VNWFDFLLLAVLVVGALYGVKLGLIKAVFVTVGVYIGWLVAGQLSPKIGGIFEGSLSNDTIVSVLSYTVIIAGALIASSYALKIIKPLLTIFTLGLASMVDRLGGLLLGLLMGIALSSALIVGFARLTYNLDTSAITDLAPEQVVDRLVERLDPEDVRESLETALTESQLVPTFIDAAGALPGNALGYIPSDFKIALDLLEINIEKTSAE
jgi:uncharacterized membrane protein required for colicin V production